MQGRLVVAAVVAFVFCSSILAAGDDDGMAVDFAIEAPLVPVRVGRPFDVTVAIGWNGSATKWVAKMIHGPTLSGLRELGHGVTARVMHGADGPYSKQMHRFTFVADAVGMARVGAIEFTLVGQGGTERLIGGKALEIPIFATWFDSLQVSFPRAVTVFLIASCLVVVVVANALRRRRVASGAIGVDGAAKSQGMVAERLSDLGRLCGDDDCKVFYATAVDALVVILEARGSMMVGRDTAQIEAALESFDEVGAGLRRGLRKFLEEVHLVRFAGLRPERSERDGVVSRLRELAAPLLVDGEDDVE